MLRLEEIGIAPWGKMLDGGPHHSILMPRTGRSLSHVSGREPTDSDLLHVESIDLRALRA